MKYLSVCSGIEAATVAWHGLGWEPVAFAEIEAFPAAVLAHHYSTVPNLGDLTKYREWPEELLVEVDLLVGGTPCQAFSVAGQRRSLDDERGNLSLTYVNLFHHINEVRKRYGRSPAIAIWENVPGVLSTKDNAFGCFIGGLLGCDEAPATESGKWDKAGFLSSETVRVGYRVLDAQYFGVAQRRRRVFLAAVPCELVERFGERACPSEILSLRESVLGNPPSRGAAWEGVARTTAAGTASRGRGVAGTLDSNYHKGCGERAGVEREVVIDAPPVCGTLSDGAHMGGGLTGRTHTPAESCPCVANPLTARMHKGINTTADEGQTPIVTQGGAFSRAAFTVSERGQAVAVRPAKTGANGHGVADEVTHTIDQVQGQAIAFKPGQSEAAGGTFVTEEFTTTMQAQNNGSTAVRAVSVDLQNVAIGGDVAGTLDTTRPSRGGGQDVAFTKAKRAQSNEDDESWVPGEVAPTQNQFDQGDTRATTVVAFSPLQGGRSMPVPPESPTLEAGTGNKTPAVAFANRTGDGIKVPEVMKDGVVPALTNPGNGGRADAVNIVAPGPVSFNAYQRTEGHATWPIGASDGRKVEVGVRSGMQVRRLFPSECEALQGFPVGYTDVTYRKKPAADGPRYRALGNSMAVPCMWWLGKRIHEATQCD